MHTTSTARAVLMVVALAAGPDGLHAQDIGPGGQAVATEAPRFGVEALRDRIEAYRATGSFRAGGEAVHSRTALPGFYLARDFGPAWLTPGGAWTARADSALALLGGARLHGFEPGDYHLAVLDVLAGRVRTGGASVVDQLDAELLLTDALLMYGSHLLLGRVDPERVEAEWIANRREGQLEVALERAVVSGRIRGFTAGLVPAQPEYLRLLRALADLRTVREQGGWGTVDAGATLRAGETDPRIAAMRHRLSLSTDSTERVLARRGAASPELFDQELEEAVRKFQLRHGLDADGAAGDRTREAMNIPVGDRITQLVVNLERWRWLPDQLGTRHVRVNIAAFETEVWDQGRVAMHLRSIVGRQYRMTPSFSAEMRYLVLAPYWHVPPTIASVDKFPLIQQDPGYVARSNMTLFATATNTPVDPTSVDWSGMTGREFNQAYRLRQEPGPANALGDVKFMFPNRHNVYLHDTPDRTLFGEAVRSFSSGCIRVENPLELARFLLGDQPGWDAERIRQAVAGGRERTVNLSETVPVYLLYFTAFVEADGTVHFRPDIYGRDAAVLRALEGDPPGP